PPLAGDCRRGARRRVFLADPRAWIMKVFMAPPPSRSRRIARYFRFAFLALLAGRAGAQSPVPVRDEPLHKVVLENSYLRLIDVRIPPGGQTLYHIHKIP